MLSLALDLAGVLLAVSLLLAGVRAWRGPDLLDRVLALDALYVNAAALLVVQGIRAGDALQFEAALVIALLGFVATVAFAKYALRGDTGA